MVQFYFSGPCAHYRWLYDVCHLDLQGWNLSDILALVHFFWDIECVWLPRWRCIRMRRRCRLDHRPQLFEALWILIRILSFTANSYWINILLSWLNCRRGVWTIEQWSYHSTVWKYSHLPQSRPILAGSSIFDKIFFLSDVLVDGGRAQNYTVLYGPNRNSNAY